MKKEVPQKCECCTPTKSKAIFANQAVEGEGDTFWFNHKEPNERGHRNQKTSNCLSIEAAFGILKIKAGLRFKNNLCTQIARRRFHDKSHEGDFTTNRTKTISQQDSTHVTSRKQIAQRGYHNRITRRRYHNMITRRQYHMTTTTVSGALTRYHHCHALSLQCNPYE
jgi:hypothetical protein